MVVPEDEKTGCQESASSKFSVLVKLPLVVNIVWLWRARRGNRRFCREILNIYNNRIDECNKASILRFIQNGAVFVDRTVDQGR